jgi:ABC-2 type transport system permease protein
MNSHAISAIFRRNFLSYFNSPTGYVFICLFVMLSSFAAFYPYDFFNNNLDNLDQLNRYLPYILLFFIPAITMSIWADERRQGTDELLLTLPTGDLDVVLGKFLAGLGVYSVSLMFSMICNLLMLRVLGSPDLFLFASNYIGYWLMGMAMIATGMVASFLTGNLTVAFILGVVFNAPLVFADWADSVVGSQEWIQVVKHWGMPEQFRDFGRGMISLSATMYFCLVAVVMLYLCLVLIGRRHWMGGRDGRSMLGHYLVRFVCLAVAAVSLDRIVEACDFLRYDVTAERVSSLSPDTKSLLRGLDTKNRPIHIDAYISPTVPENYVETRLTLLNDLHEFEELGGGRIRVRVVSTEPTTEEATNAEQQFGIRPHPVRGSSRGTMKDDQIIMGAAITCGLQKVIVPFFDRGTPIEYELIRSIATVADAKRKRLGVVNTDAQLFGGFDMQRMTSTPRQQIIDELEKQYEVVQVDPSKPIEKFDVLLAVQPSSLAQPQLFNLIDAIRSGQPTAIFEDPLPVLFEGVPGTTDERRSPMQGMQPPPKGDIGALWSLLGVKYVSKDRGGQLGGMPSSDSVVWQDWNPYRKLSGIPIPREYVFIGPDETGGKMPFNNESPITSGLEQLWFPFPGAIEKLNSSKMKFVELVTTGDKTGAIPADQLRNPDKQTLAEMEAENATRENYCLAAYITGEVKGKPAPDADKPEEKAGDKKADQEKAKSAVEEAAKKRAAEATHEVNVVLVSDIDLMADPVFQLRSSGEEAEIEARFENVPFVLNVLDVLAGDTRFVEIRKRKASHRTLTTIERVIANYRDDRDAEEQGFRDKYSAEIQKAQAGDDEFVAKVRDLQKKAVEMRRNGDDITPELQEELSVAALGQQVETQRIKNRVDQLKREEAKEQEKLDRTLNSNIYSEQKVYKILAVVLPPILPFIVGVFVFFSRRAQEREGVAKSRLR